MIKVEKYGIILSPTELEFENNAVFNPGIFQDGNIVHIFYRAVQNGNFSTIGHAIAEGPLNITSRKTYPIITRDFDYECHGVEDARIVKIEEVFYLTYTSYDGHNALGSLATSTDLIHFDKKGIITPQIKYEDFENIIKKFSDEELNQKYHQFYKLFLKSGFLEDKKLYINDKDVVFFPRKIDNQFAMLHRIWPGIQIVKFNHWDELTEDFWIDYFNHLPEHIVLDPKGEFDINYLGAGGPPIETDLGWLLIYHGVQETSVGRTYHAMAALLDIDHPQTELARLEYPIFSPTKDWEKVGEVNNVVFPSGNAIFDDDLYIYYGAADHHIAVAKVSMHELLLELSKQIKIN
jgi:beta-1,2-mannobiose phosphorylase / 1,2-beta-oligomannan phosphorylase